MRSKPWFSPARVAGLVILAYALVSTGTVGAQDAHDTSQRAGAPRDTATLRPVVRILTPAEWDEVNLRRATSLWIDGDLPGAAQLLETIDITPSSPFTHADRAAYLLAIAYLRQGDAASFRRVAEQAGSHTGSPYRRWIRYCELVVAGRGGESHADTSTATGALPTDIPGADILAASILLENGRPADALRALEATETVDALRTVDLYLRALAREASNQDAGAEWRQLSGREARTTMEADLIGSAIMRLAAQRIERGEDPGDILDRVPDKSRHVARASHIRALTLTDAGDHPGAREILSALLKEHPEYELHREVELMLGGLTMHRDDWSALRYFEAAEADLNDELQQLDRLTDPATITSVWRTWEQQALWRDELRIAPDALMTALDRLADASLDLNIDQSLDRGSVAESLWPPDTETIPRPAWDSTLVLARHQPDASEWHSLRAVQREREHVMSLLQRQRRDVRDRQHAIEQHVRYLDRGTTRARASERDISAAIARLDTVLADLDVAVLQLQAARDSALVNIATRTRDMIDNIQRELIFMQALEHFHVDGPNRDRPEKFPEGVPSPAELLTMETSLADLAEQFLTLFAGHYPGVINRSFDEIWEPRLTGGTRQLRAALLAQLLRARHISANLDSTIAAYASDPALLAAMRREQELTRAADSLGNVEAEVRRDIAATVADRGRTRLALEQEAIDYNIADASYELAVTIATDVSTAEDTTAVAPYRRRAIRRLETFLDRHGESVARGESRFRLADMRLMQARDDFHIRMASFIDGAPTADDLENRALAPFVNYGPAVSLYKAILAEDQDFLHMDAVLFNLGMILSDDGQSEATTYLARLVEQYPDSPNCQEAWLRMGSDLFDRKQFGTSLAYFEEAAAGTDPEFTAIALYKLGWAQFEQDDFVQSADAFRRLIDHYNANADLAEDMDLRDEAEEYLVHSLARSGGASAFSDYFNQLGSRPYESQILMSLGHLMKSLSLYEEAVECDELWLARYPRHEMALAVAERLVATYRSWNKPEQARAAKLAQAERFLPGSSWHVANTDAATRDAALEFAQGAYRENAAHYHRLARKSDNADEWRAALSNYEQYLTYWPKADDAARIHYLAGESAFRLEGFEMALEHFRSASVAERGFAAGGDSTVVDSVDLAMDASWQMVAVADAWYRGSGSTGASSAPGGTDANTTAANAVPTGSDALARKLIDTGDYFLERFPADARSADIVWRQGNVAYAHGWYDEAAVRLHTMSERYASDTRAVAAVRMSGDARYQMEQYDAAGAAYESALGLAEIAGDDSTAAALRPVIPLCYYKHAESIAAADKSNGEMNAAPLFARVAERWPAFEHADRALYRSGLGFAALGQHIDAATAWERLLTGYPESEYARDSAIQIAIVLEQSGNKKSAASAYERFSRLHTDDPDAPEALLKAIDLLAETNDESGAEDMRSLFLKRFPDDKEAAIAIREVRAVKDLARVSAGGASLSALLSAGTAAGTAAGSAADGAGKAAASELKEYLALAEAHPELASPVILAQVDYLKAEEVYPQYKAMRLTQPLPAAIEAKKTRMQELLAIYETCTSRGVAEYSRASAHRIGQVLIDFGDALIASERPADLNEDDLYAYDEVIAEQGWGFYDRGEDVWVELLRQVGDAKSDPGEWIARTRQALWPRLGQRFLYQPEVEYPLVKATRPVTTQR